MEKVKYIDLRDVRNLIFKQLQSIQHEISINREDNDYINADRNGHIGDNLYNILRMIELLPTKDFDCETACVNEIFSNDMFEMFSMQEAQNAMWNEVVNSNLVKNALKDNCNVEIVNDDSRNQTTVKMRLNIYTPIEK